MVIRMMETSAESLVAETSTLLHVKTLRTANRATGFKQMRRRRKHIIPEPAYLAPIVWDRR